MKSFTLKDIEQMRNRITSNMTFYVEVEEDNKTSYIYYESFDNLINYVKENYKNDLTHKENVNKKILGVRIWRE